MFLALSLCIVTLFFLAQGKRGVTAQTRRVQHEKTIALGDRRVLASTSAGKRPKRVNLYNWGQLYQPPRCLRKSSRKTGLSRECDISDRQRARRWRVCAKAVTALTSWLPTILSANWARGALDAIDKFNRFRQNHGNIRARKMDGLYPLIRGRETRYRGMGHNRRSPLIRLSMTATSIPLDIVQPAGSS